MQSEAKQRACNWGTRRISCASPPLRPRGELPCILRNLEGDSDYVVFKRYILLETHSSTLASPRKALITTSPRGINYTVRSRNGHRLTSVSSFLDPSFFSAPAGFRSFSSSGRRTFLTCRELPMAVKITFACESCGTGWSFRTFFHFRGQITFALSGFRTFLLSHVRTFALSGRFLHFQLLN